MLGVRVVCASGLEGDEIRSRHLRALLRVCNAFLLTWATDVAGDHGRPRMRLLADD